MIVLLNCTVLLGPINIDRSFELTANQNLLLYFKAEAFTTTSSAVLRVEVAAR